MKPFATLILFLAWLMPAAQTSGAILVESQRHPLPALFQIDVVSFLSTTPPAETQLYAVMSYAMNTHGEFVSLAGLDPNTPPPYDWSLEDGNVIWTGTLTRVNGVIELYQPNRARAQVMPLASVAYPLIQLLPSLDGGGTEIYFPWATGSQMMFGTRGVHGGGFGITGAVGIDWLSGDDFGGLAAPPTVYASTDGTITDVCTDDHSMAIKVEGTAETIGYYHLEIDSAMTNGTTVTRGQPIGNLVYGSFNDDCGWAEQQPDHYHLHWVIVPDGNSYQAEGWTLHTGDEEWSRGSTTVGPSQWLQGGGGFGSYGSGEDDPGSAGTGTLVIVPGQDTASSGGGKHLWDYVLLGVNSFYTAFKNFYMPSDPVNAGNEQFWTIAANMMRAMVETANLVLVNDVITFAPVYILTGVVLGLQIIKLAASGAIVAFSVLRLIRGGVKWW
jgi:hypothetical protein